MSKTIVESPKMRAEEAIPETEPLAKAARQVPNGHSLADVLHAIKTEIGLGVPDINYLTSLGAEMMSMYIELAKKASQDISERKSTDVFGANPDSLTNEIVKISDEIKAAIDHKIAQIEASKLVNEQPIPVDSRPILNDDEAMNSVTKELLDARLETIETRMDGRIANVEVKIDGKFAEVDAKFAELRTDMHKGFADMTKWIVGTVIGVAAVSVTIMTFVLNNATPKASPVPQAPIVVYAQPPVLAPASQPETPPKH